MEQINTIKICKYCTNKLEVCTDEGLECENCQDNVHVRCLKRGAVPGALNGDVFFNFTCENCSETRTEIFTRKKLSWVQVIVLVLYHLQTRSTGLARKGFFHWRNHVASFIDKHWALLFGNDVKKRNKWTGTIAGTLSHFSRILFCSGTALFNEQAWWTLRYPKLSPNVISILYSMMSVEKQKAKLKNEKKLITDDEYFQEIIKAADIPDDLIQRTNLDELLVHSAPSPTFQNEELSKVQPGKQKDFNNKRKNLVPIIEMSSNKFMKLGSANAISSDDLTSDFNIIDLQEKSKKVSSVSSSSSNTSLPGTSKEKEPVKKLLDPFCHFNTSLNDISRVKGLQLKTKLTGGLRVEPIHSPYSGIYLKPYIRRDTETFPVWLKLMAELQLRVNKKDSSYTLPPRAPLDYTYVQLEHIPAINSICNQFFWPGIDVTDTLRYPDFSCVVMYKKLVVGFAFLVPDVSYTENYISFIFTRPAWRNCGIATFMLYHLIQTSLGKDITLHVSINNPALLLYQKFGFKVEQIVQLFYDKYYRDDVKESKHAFFCRLER